MNLSRPVTSVVRSLEGRIFSTLSRASDGLTGSRIAHLIEDASNPGVQTALKRMVHEGTVLRRQAGSAGLYELNREHILWPAIDHLVSETDSAVRQLETRIVSLVQEILGDTQARAVTLAFFGSVARASSTADSDIDIVAVFPAVVDDVSAERVVHQLTAKVPQWTGNACSIYALSEAEAADLRISGDPILRSWQQDARTFNGPELRDILHLTRQSLTMSN
ncbi:MAG: hypothetical protein JWR01_1587 [Subtercola sp.]|nr:hypothetical protein [Subtercola sp.]